MRAAAHFMVALCALSNGKTSTGAKSRYKIAAASSTKARFCVEHQTNWHVLLQAPETYNLIKNVMLCKLQAYFQAGKVLPLIEAPEKEDYGKCLL